MDHGARAYVVMRDDVYRRLLGPTLREMIPPSGDDIEFEPARMSDDIFRPVNRRYCWAEVYASSVQYCVCKV
jgi:hypothetical protein